jgi:hypothetical protein
MKTNKFLPFYFLTILSGILLFSQDIQSQPLDSIWQNHYGGTGYEIGFDAIEGENGCYYVIGKTKPFGSDNYDAYILKLNNNGSLIWDKSYGGSLEEQIVSVCPAHNGGYVMTGYTSSIGQQWTQIWLLWINEDGDSLWSKTYGGESADNGLYISPTDDQGYIVSATWGTGAYMGDQICLMKLDAAGDSIWAKTFGGPYQDYGEEVIQTSDGGYIIAGRTYASIYPEGCDAWVIKTDSNGDTVWTHKYGGSDEDMFNCVVETSDGYLFAGVTHSFGPGIYSVWAVRTNDSGDTIWTRTYGGDIVNMCFNISKTINDHFVLVGYSNSFNEDNDVYVLEIDIDGNMVWEDHYGIAAASEVVYGSRQTSEREFIVTGRTNYYTTMKDEVFVMKLGNATGITDEKNKIDPLLSNYPNPFKSNTTIYLNIVDEAVVDLCIFNSMGVLVETLISGQVLRGRREILWNASGMVPGVYFCRLQAGNESVICKISLIK